MDLRESFSSPHGPPFKLRGFQPYQSRRFVGAHLCEFWDFQVSTPPPNSDCILFYVGRHRRPPRISLGAAWATNDHFGGILSFSEFSRNPQIKKHRLLNVSRDSFRRTSGVSMRDRCPVISNPWFIQKLRFFIDLFMVGVSLASRWGNLLITQWISMALFKFPRFYLAMGGFRV